MPNAPKQDHNLRRDDSYDSQQHGNTQLATATAALLHTGHRTELYPHPETIAKYILILDPSEIKVVEL